MKRSLQAKFRLSAMGALPMAGFAGLYLLPLSMTFWYSTVVSSFDKTTVGVENYSYVWSNTYFRLGITNLLVLGLLCLTGAVFLALLLAWLLGEHPRLAGTAAVLVLPLLIPSVSAISLWNRLFRVDILTPWPVSMLALSTLYWWKCSGSAAVLLYIGLAGLPQEVLDAAALDGCGKVRLFFQIRLPMIRNESVLAIFLLFMYYFRIYKESYLLFGQYPSNELYLVQHYMNNQYLKMNVQYVSAAAVSLVAVCTLIFGSAALLAERRAQT